MVSLWPWKADNSSPASFEKVLSNLASKITKTQLQLDSLRAQSRRFSALWTLYTSFTYLLCLIILALVVGWQNWGSVEYSALSGSPVMSGITTYYNYRIENATRKLEAQQADRAATIEKLKAATKYNSTQQLLDKYGETPRKLANKTNAKSTPQNTPQKGKQGQQPQRTGLGPPATANIQRDGPAVSLPSSPATAISQGTPRPFPTSGDLPPRADTPTAEFAPNAFSSQQQYASGVQAGQEGKWYDRIFDVLLGEDESSPKNRTVLLCQHCKLVNGQAPPGMRDTSELGKWRCMGCGGVNGEDDEAAKVVKAFKDNRITEDESEKETEMVEATIPSDLDTS